MRNRKNNKRALIVSCLSLLLCVSMLVGSTMAWFTDNASTGVNTIQAGELDVILEMWDGESWVDAEGKTLDFIAKDGRNDILWEPGATYNLPKLRIRNDGNLALKFKLLINGLTGDGAKLAEVLEVKQGDHVFGTLDTLAADENGAAYGNLSAGAASDEYTLSLHMQENAGNEYQNLKLNSISITVHAAQHTEESDSFDNQYDKDAEFDMSGPADVWDGSDNNGIVPEPKEEPVLDGNGDPTGETIKVIEITTAEEFAALATSVNAGTTYAGHTVKLNANLDLDNQEWTPIGTSTTPFKGNFDGQGHTISNLKITKEIGNIAACNRQGLFGTIVPSGATYFQNLTLHNANVTAGYHVGAVIATSDNSSQTATGNYLVVTNIKLTGKVTIEGWEGVGGVMGSGNMAELSNITVSVDSGSYVSNTVGGPDDAFSIVGSVKGGGYLSKIDNVVSNMDVRGKTASIGGLFGIIGGQTVNCEMTNVSYSGKVTVYTSTELQWAYGRYSYNGLLIGSPRFNVTADQATCTSTGTLELHTEVGIKTSNDMGDVFTWGEDLFGASRDNTYTNKSYAG